MTDRPATYLPAGLPRPQAEPDGLSAPFWHGLSESRVLIQRCSGCGTWQWPAEWICHRCHRFDPAWEQVPGRGTIHSFTRAWYPAHAALRKRGPYCIGVIDVDVAHVRLVGNLLIEDAHTPAIGAPVNAVFESHESEAGPFTLLQWRSIPPGCGAADMTQGEDDPG